MMYPKTVQYLALAGFFGLLLGVTLILARGRVPKDDPDRALKAVRGGQQV